MFYPSVTYTWTNAEKSQRIQRERWEKERMKRFILECLCIGNTLRVFHDACCIAMNAILRLHTKFRCQEYASHLPPCEIQRALRYCLCAHTNTIVLIQQPYTHTEREREREQERATDTHTPCVYLYIVRCCLCHGCPKQKRIERKCIKIYQHSAKQTSLKCVVVAVSTYRHVVPHSIYFTVIWS